MPRIEHFHPVNVYHRFQEWRATNIARREFKSWQMQHPVEAQILDLLDQEFKHKAVAEIPESAKLYDVARQARRGLGFSDHLVRYAHENAFQLEELLARDGVELGQEEMRLLKEVNHGFWARVGVFTKGVRRLQRLG